MRLKYLLKRILMIIPTFLGITVFAYFLSALAPGSPLDRLLVSSQTTQETVEMLRHAYGLDQSLVVQYLRWLVQLIHGNLGVSYRTSEPVLAMVLSRIGPTLLITLTSVFISVALAIPMGIGAAVKPYSLWDYVASGISFLAAATPNFFASLLLVYIFAVTLKLLPTGGMYATTSARSLPDLLSHMVLPVAVLVFQQLGDLIRQVRASLMEVLQEDYIRTAKAKGLSGVQIVIGHALKNALIPVVTVVGMNLPFIIGGAVVTEQIFGWPGIGTLMVQSINARDYPSIMGITVFIAVVVLIGNLLIDLIYGLLDPRISYK